MHYLFAAMGLPGGRVTRQQRKPEPGMAAQASKHLGIGMTSALSTLLFLYLGTLADGRLGTEPWLTLMGAFVGAGAGFYYMYHHLVVVPRQKPPEGKADR
jgi:F0F1-type ATP synthase assembly protein I